MTWAHFDWQTKMDPSDRCGMEAQSHSILCLSDGSERDRRTHRRKLIALHSQPESGLYFSSFLYLFIPPFFPPIIPLSSPLTSLIWGVEDWVLSAEVFTKSLSHLHFTTLCNHCADMERRDLFSLLQHVRWLLMRAPPSVCVDLATWLWHCRYIKNKSSAGLPAGLCIKTEHINRFEVFKFH